MSKGISPPSSYPWQSKSSPWKTVALTAILSACAALVGERYLLSFLQPTSKALDTTRQCRPPLPNLFILGQPIDPDAPEIKTALKAIDGHIRHSFARGGTDGLAVAVVTPEGALYETGLGFLKANETDPDKRGVVDRHSIFRLASGSKLFAVLETLILREKGALQWDDPIDKFFPEFTYASGGWADRESTEASESSHKEPLTLRQLASHMSGLTREYPRGNMPNWPHSDEGQGPPPTNGCPFPTTEETIKGLAKYPLVVPPYSYPVYSNAGMAVLGQVAVVANAALENKTGAAGTPTSWPTLAKRDIFDRLGMNGSSFVVTPQNKAHVAVAAKNSDEVDLDFLDAMSCSGGQMSSLSDYIKVMQTILDPTRPESLLPPHVIREWLRPLHGWTDETTEVGMLWEIEKIYDTYTRPLRIFQKLGVLGASRSVFAVNQEMSYGVALLMTGTASFVGDVVLDIFRHMQPTLDRLLATQVASLYSGRWLPKDDDNSEVAIKVSDGSLWITKLVLKGTDVLAMTQQIPPQESWKAMPITLWSTGRLHEFRMVLGAPNEHGALSYSTCMRYWASIDNGFSRGYPMDLVYFTESADGLVLRIPSAEVTLIRR